MTAPEWIAVIGAIGGALLALVREWRMARREQLDHMHAMRSMEEARFEQLARRDRRARRARESDAPTTRTSRPVPRGEFEDEPSTDIHEIREEKQRELERSRGLRVPRPGQHHDKER
jgi:hypothetical protein